MARETSNIPMDLISRKKFFPRNSVFSVHRCVVVEVSISSESFFFLFIVKDKSKIWIESVDFIFSTKCFQ